MKLPILPCAEKLELVLSTAVLSNAVLGVTVLSVCVSVCPSITRVLCDKTKQGTADVLIPHEMAIICAQSDPPPSKTPTSTEFRKR